MQAGGLKQYLLPFVKQQVGNMLMEIDEDCLREANFLAMSIDTLSLEGLNVQGIDPTKSLISQLNKMDNTNPNYEVLVEMLVSKLVSNFDSYIQNKFENKKMEFIGNIPNSVPKFLQEGYPNGWKNESKDFTGVVNRLSINENYFKNYGAAEKELQSHPLEEESGLLDFYNN